MLKNYLKTAARELINRKYYSIIIIIGFTIGIASWIFIMLWMNDEEKSIGVDENMLCLYRIGSLDREMSEVWLDSNQIFHFRLTPETPFPLAPILKKYEPMITETARFGYFGDKRIVYGKKSNFEKRMAFADKEFFKLFKYSIISGNLSDFSNINNSVIMTKNMANKYFSDENPIGKMLNADNEYQLKVIAVIKNIPEYYKIQFDFIAPISLLTDSSIVNDWTENRVNTYILIKKNTPILALKQDISRIIEHNNPNNNFYYNINRLPRLHSYSDIRADAEIGGNIQFIYTFSALALFIIFIACINYFNISVSQFANRAKEIAIRKTYGAQKRNIVIQFLIEGQILSFISLLIALILIVALLPQFNNIASRDIHLSFRNNDSILINSIIITFLVGLVASFYPAFYFSSLIPARIFSSTLRAGAKNIVFRKLISYIQFFISVALIIAAFKVDKQMEHLRNTKVGYDDEYIIELPLTKNIENKIDAFEKDLKLNTDILGMETKNKTDIDSSKNITNPIKLRNSEQFNIDFLTVSFKPRHIAYNINYIGRIWKEYEKDSPFEYYITDADLEKEFLTEVIMGKILNYFTYASVFITLLGFFCFSSFICVQRKAEIAIRKTFGASSFDIYFLLIKEFLIISLVAIISAHIMVAFTASTWLQKFSDRISDFGVSEYVIPTIISIVLLILTVSYHAIKASRKAPAEVLKRE